jgi:hypothetical protein
MYFTFSVVAFLLNSHDISALQSPDEVNIKPILLGPIDSVNACRRTTAVVLLKPAVNVESHQRETRSDTSAKGFKIIYIFWNPQHSLVRNKA